MFWRIISAVFILLAAVFCRSSATESLSSNTVGFWKINIHRGFTQVSFPLLPTNKTVNNVLAGQLTGGATALQSDQVLRWNHATNSFQMVWYNTGTSAWEGDFTTFAEAQSYWIYVPASHPETQTLMTFGNVVEASSFNMGSMTLGYNAVGSVWAAPAPLAQAGLGSFQGGNYLFQSDLLLSYDALTGSFSYAWKNQSGVWQGTLTQLEPLKGYWLYIAPGHTGFNWNNYPQPVMGNPSFLPLLLTIPEDRVSSDVPALLPPVPAALPGSTPAISGGE
jgi:hypothetical protein